MRLIGLALEMESVYEMIRVCINLFFRNALSYNTDVVVESHNAIVPKQFFIDFVVVRFIHANRAFTTLILKFCFLYQSCN